MSICTLPVTPSPTLSLFILAATRSNAWTAFLRSARLMKTAPARDTAEDVSVYSVYLKTRTKLAQQGGILELLFCHNTGMLWKNTSQIQNIYAGLMISHQNGGSCLVELLCALNFEAQPRQVSSNQIKGASHSPVDVETLSCKLHERRDHYTEHRAYTERGDVKQDIQIHTSSLRAGR